ncbi:hypothetical protein [Trichlorobacter lovleyi]|uniref:hypothetical protein n=2 Tax=Trichlorobacter lovleyi TaxID=313985 RepID=UPI002FDE2299
MLMKAMPTLSLMENICGCMERTGLQSDWCCQNNTGGQWVFGNCLNYTLAGLKHIESNDLFNIPYLAINLVDSVTNKVVAIHTERLPYEIFNCLIDVSKSIDTELNVSQANKKDAAIANVYFLISPSVVCVNEIMRAGDFV